MSAKIDCSAKVRYACCVQNGCVMLKMLQSSEVICTALKACKLLLGTNLIQTGDKSYTNTKCVNTMAESDLHFVSKWTELSRPSMTFGTR